MSTQQIISHLMSQDLSFNLGDGNEWDVHLRVIPQNSGDCLLRTISIEPIHRSERKLRSESAGERTSIEDVKYILKVYQDFVDNLNIDYRGKHNEYYPWCQVGRLVEFLVENGYAKAIKGTRLKRRPRFADMFSRLNRGLLRPQDFWYLADDVVGGEEWITDEEIQDYWDKLIAYVVATTRLKASDQHADLIAYVNKLMQ